jgi:hypothetical protein
MKKRGLVLSAFAVTFAMTLGGVAHAATLGITSQPDGSFAATCGPPAAIAQHASDPNTTYSVPGPGTITQWQTVSSVDDPGDSLTLLVLKPAGASSYTVVGTDTRSIDDPAPDVSTFTLSAPIAVSGGETLGLWTPGDASCFFSGGDTPPVNNLQALGASSEPTSGQTLNQLGTISPSGFTTNVAANFVPASAPAPPAPTSPHHKKKKCKKNKGHKKHKKRSAQSAKKKHKKCKKKKKR